MTRLNQIITTPAFIAPLGYHSKITVQALCREYPDAFRTGTRQSRPHFTLNEWSRTHDAS